MRLWRTLLALAVALGGVGVVVLGVGSSPANAAACFTWTRDLKRGDTGNDVRELQIRLAGWAAYRTVLGIDGDFGPATEGAVKRFQAAYGLAADGRAGPATRSKIYSLTDADCTPAHFTYNELSPNCGNTGNFSGGAVSATEAKHNAFRTMWKLEALRHQLGDQPLRITSGFRSRACNASSGGASNSRHLYGDAADIGSGAHSLCTIIKQARYAGFGGLLGPGYAGHGDHIHADGRSSIFWSASSCGVS